MEKHIVCISCPTGCRLTVFENESEEVVVTGNLCNRGETYGKEEFSNPKRMVTAVVRTGSREIPFAPVKTDRALERELIPGLLKTLYAAAANVPVKCGDVLIRGYRGTDVNIVFTRSVSE